MKFKLINNLIIVSIEYKNYLLDTGSNRSFSLLDSDIELVINDEKYHLERNIASHIVKDTLSKLVPGEFIDGLIGTDIISKTNLTIDYLNNEIYFGLVKCSYDIEQHHIPFEVSMGYLFTYFYMKSYRLKMLIDSGAGIGYVKSKYLDLSKPICELNDYSPEVGEIKGNTYCFYDSLHQENVLVGKLPEVYEFICDGIVPLYEFVRPGYCSFDFTKKIFSFTRRFL